MNRSPLHPITDADIRTYEEDGVVCLRGQFDADWIARMLAEAVAQLDQPDGFRVEGEAGAEAGRAAALAKSHMARRNDTFKAFVEESPAAEITARLMGLDEVRFFYDQLFIKEPGTHAATAWHHDLPFWPLDGNHVASVWLALTPVTKATSGLVYLAGSHKWGKLYRPVPAVPREGFAFPEADAYEECPQFHKEFGNPDHRFLAWNMEPGDCLVHHPLTVHGAGDNASSDQRRVALSCRFFGGDVTWHGQRTVFQVPGSADEMFEVGAFPGNDDVFPVVWRAAA